MSNKIVKSNRKSTNKIVKPKNKTCKKFCKEVFLPERERVEIIFSKKLNNKFKYKTIKRLRKTNKRSSLAKLLEKLYLKNCDDIYCQKECKNKKSWIKSFTKNRKENLIKKGAIYGCRDLIKEFPEYYKNI